MTASTLTDTNAVTCPTCGGQMWDNRKDKKNPKAPDWKCRDRSCKGVIWPPKGKPADITPIQTQTTANTVLSLDPPRKPTMREAYKQLTEWVISDIAPIYEATFGDETFSQEVAAACVQTLFIQACQSGKVE